MEIRRLNVEQDLSTIEQIWNKIYRDENDYFLSWNWVKTFIDVYSGLDDILFSYVRSENSEVIYFTIKNDINVNWHLKNYIKRLTLNSSNNIKSAMPTPEFISMLYQGFDNEVDALNFLLSSLPKCDVVYINYSSVLYDGNLNYKYKLDSKSKVYKVLNSKIIDFTSYLGSLRKKTRYSIRFSEKYFFEKYGDISLEASTSSEEMLESLSILTSYSISRQASIGRKSSFEDIHFVKFIETFIKQSPQDMIILRISSGEKILGIMMFFTSNNKAKFYQCGFISENNKKVSTGMLCNYLSIKYFYENNYSEYNFLAGDALYKRLLSNDFTYLYDYSFYKGVIGKLVMLFLKIKSFKNKISSIGVNNA